MATTTTTALTGPMAIVSQNTKKGGLLTRLRYKVRARKHAKLRTAIFAARTLEDLVEFHVRRALEYVREFAGEAPVDVLISRYIDAVGVGMNIREEVYRNTLAAFDDTREQ